MVEEFKFPDVGEGIHEGQLVKWLVKEGDTVKQDQSIAEVETDKAIVEIPSPTSGAVLKLHAKEGSVINVGDVIVTFGGKDEKPNNSDRKKDEKSEKSSKEELMPKESGKQTTKKDASNQSPIHQSKVLATLHTRKLAQKLGVTLSTVSGTGFNARITDEDVELAASKLSNATEKENKNEENTSDDKKKEEKTNNENKIVKSEIRKTSSSKVTFSKFGKILEVPLTNLRKKIAQKMQESKQTAPHVTHSDIVDLTALAEVRAKEKKAAENKAIHLTYLSFITKAVLKALKDHPYLNASMDDDEGIIVLKKYYNIGIAVDTADGLMVPNIKNADSLSIMEIAKKIESLASRAKERSLEIKEMQGGTFTITNVGSIGGTFFTPVLNYPEVAILGLGRMSQEPKVFDGNVEIRKVMPLSLSFDHRVVDGALAARFMNDIIKHLEDPQLLLIDA